MHRQNARPIHKENQPLARFGFLQTRFELPFFERFLLLQIRFRGNLPPLRGSIPIAFKNFRV